MPAIDQGRFSGRKASSILFAALLATKTPSGSALLSGVSLAFLPNHDHASLVANGVVRARRAIYGERGGENGDAQTRVDWDIASLVLEQLEEVARLVKAELRSFTSLTTKDGSKIWFDAKKAAGPIPITSSQRQGGVKSSIKIMGYRQFVTESPTEVRDVIKRAGGTPT